VRLDGGRILKAGLTLMGLKSILVRCRRRNVRIVVALIFSDLLVLMKLIRVRYVPRW
jgi:hypothetical protein